jgi:hypothetical protein
MLSEQIALAAVCNHFRTTDQRLARWLLLACDRTLWNLIERSRSPSHLAKQKRNTLSIELKYGH